jgi:dynein heavy chain
LIQDYYEETRTNIPVIYLLSQGADPTSSIDEFARKKKIITNKVSMGEEMQFPAAKMMDAGMLTG